MSISNVLSSLALPKEAVCWLSDLWLMIQTLDDYADGDAVTRDELDSLIVTSLVSFPANAFYLANVDRLSSAVATMVLKWKASDTVERSGKHSEKSFVWRAGYYDIVLLVVALVHGMDKAMTVSQDVLNIYGEEYADYKKEFDYA